MQLGNSLCVIKRGSAALAFIFAFGLCGTHAQQPTLTQPQQSPTALPPTDATEAAPTLIAGETEIYCGGFIQYAPSPNYLEIVGGEEEQEQRVYSAGDYVFLNAGAQHRIQPGQHFSVVRPRGQFTTKLTKKRGWLGVYTEEVGRLRVTEVKDQTSIAVVIFSCEAILLGDLLRAVPQRTAPETLSEATLDRFAEASRKQTGRIVLARDGRELLAKNQVVFIDLGGEDNIKAGDTLTIYRPAGTGNITRFRDDEVTPAADSGFQSERFRGGKFSNKAQRVKRPNQTGIFGPTVSTPDVKRRRPPVPRKVVGQLVVLNIERRTATAVITSVAQEVHTGDFVELR